MNPRASANNWKRITATTSEDGERKKIAFESTTNRKREKKKEFISVLLNRNAFRHVIKQNDRTCTHKFEKVNNDHDSTSKQ